MKLRNKIIAMSTVAALAMLTGCTKDDDNDSSGSSGSYSDTAPKFVVDYSVDEQGTTVVDANNSYTYNDDEQVIGENKVKFTRFYKDYKDNNGTVEIAPMRITKFEAESYRKSTETCVLTPDEDGYSTDIRCSSLNVYSVAGKPEVAFENLSDFDQDYVVDGLDSLSLDPVYKDKVGRSTTKIVYNENHYPITVTYSKSKFWDNNNTLVSDSLNIGKLEFEYVTHTDDVEDPIFQTIVKTYKDEGSLDSNGTFDPIKDGKVELTGKYVYDFSYNEDGNLDIVEKNWNSINPIFKAPSGTSAPHLTYYIYDGDQLDFVTDHESDTWDGLESREKLVYVDGQLNGISGHVPNYNNEDLNEYEWNDNILEFFYDGDEVVRFKDSKSTRYSLVTYEDFDNELTSIKPLENLLDETLDNTGSNVYTQLNNIMED